MSIQPNRSRPPKEIRDPIHGAIQVGARELRVIDHPFVQRLRGIRQLGFSHLPFPGATHTRYAHSLGAMHLAGVAFDACFRGGALPSAERRSDFRHCVRLAALCHDLGHAPYSHAAEFAMPPLRALGISAYAAGRVGHRLERRAAHEDYTVGILTQSALSGLISEEFAFSPLHVAALVSPDVDVPDDFFRDGGFDLRPLLSQLVSSDLDVDRLDYLVRDAYYTGARYGEIDVRWLISHLTHHVDEGGRVNLALDRRAIYAFDDYLVARFHMFVMVYFHQRSVAFEGLLQRTMQAKDCDYRLPSDFSEYLGCDDTHLEAWLRSSSDPWARRIVEHQPYKLALEVDGAVGSVDLGREAAALEAAGIDTMKMSATGGMMGAPKSGAPQPSDAQLYVLDRTPGRPERVEPIEAATRVFKRYEDACCIARLYVPVECLPQARLVLNDGMS